MNPTGGGTAQFRSETKLKYLIILGICTKYFEKRQTNLKEPNKRELPVSKIN